MDASMHKRVLIMYKDTNLHRSWSLEGVDLDTSLSESKFTEFILLHHS